MNLSNLQVINKLKEKSGIKGATLPVGIDFSIVESTLYLNIKNPLENMQKDEAAFEGWIISIKTLLSEEIDEVELDFSAPDKVERYGTSKAGHYNRFLYRLYNMSRLFPQWFRINENKKMLVDDFVNWIKSNKCVMNQSLKERKPVIDTKSMERQVESWFAYNEGKQLLEKTWDIDKEKIFNQLPTGVFYNNIAAKNKIFTGSASAIDLWGIGNDGQSLHLIELKCRNNYKLGVISEILFYTAVIYDSYITNDPLFQINTVNKKTTKDIEVIKNNGNKFNKLYAHVLAEKYHPLFDSQVENTIKNGLANLNINFDTKKYNYSEKTILN